MRDPSFAEQYREARREAMRRTTARVQSAASEAVDALREITRTGEGDSARVSAARTILNDPVSSSRWVTEKEFARRHSLSRQTLANWCYFDRKEGRTRAGPGFPQYRRFGRAVRYWLAAEVSPGVSPDHLSAAV